MSKPNFNYSVKLGNKKLIIKGEGISVGDIELMEKVIELQELFKKKYKRGE